MPAVSRRSSVSGFSRRPASPCRPRAPVPSSSANVQSSFPPARPRLSRRRLVALMVTGKIQRGCACRHRPSPPEIHRSSASGHPQPLYHPPGQELRAGPRHSHWSADRRLPASRCGASNIQAAGPTSSLGQVAGCRARWSHPRHGSLPRRRRAGVSAGRRRQVSTIPAGARPHPMRRSLRRGDGRVFWTPWAAVFEPSTGETMCEPAPPGWPAWSRRAGYNSAGPVGRRTMVTCTAAALWTMNTIITRRRCRAAVMSGNLALSDMRR